MGDRDEEGGGCPPHPVGIFQGGSILEWGFVDTSRMGRQPWREYFSVCARQGPLEDSSRRPDHYPHRITEELEGLIVAEGRRTRYRYKRLCSYLWRKYALSVSPCTVKAVRKLGAKIPFTLC